MHSTDKVNAEIASRLFGLDPEDEVPDYAGSRSLMMPVMRKLSDATGGADWNFTFIPLPKGYVCNLTGKKGHVSSEAPTAPLAACLAAIEAAGGPRIEMKDLEDGRPDQVR